MKTKFTTSIGSPVQRKAKQTSLKEAREIIKKMAIQSKPGNLKKLNPQQQRLRRQEASRSPYSGEPGTPPREDCGDEEVLVHINTTTDRNGFVHNVPSI